MSEEHDELTARFVAGVLSASKDLVANCKDLEEVLSEAMDNGDIPPELAQSEFTPKMYVTGALLLVVCGIMADPGDDSDAMEQAAQAIRHSGVASDWITNDAIRRRIDKVLDCLGVKQTRHLWN
jgi:hypothetical protein